MKEILHEKHIKPGRCYIGEEALEKEAGWLQRANEHGIGPRFLYGDSRKVIMEFVEGKRILAFISEEHDEERYLHQPSVLRRDTFVSAARKHSAKF